MNLQRVVKPDKNSVHPTSICQTILLSLATHKNKFQNTSKNAKSNLNLIFYQFFSKLLFFFLAIKQQNDDHAKLVLKKKLRAK